MASKKQSIRHVEHPFFDYGPLEDHLRSLTDWNWIIEEIFEQNSMICVLELDIDEPVDKKSAFAESYEHWSTGGAFNKWDKERKIEIKRLELIIQPLVLSWMKETYPHLLAHLDDEILRLYVINGPLFGVSKLPSDDQQEIFNMLKEI